MFGSSNATFPARGGRSLANAGMQQMTPRGANGPQATINTKGQFDDVEQSFKFWVSGTEAGRHGLWQAWDAIDYNGNGIVSLAEIDKWVVETYPKLNNKSARSLEMIAMALLRFMWHPHDSTCINCMLIANCEALMRAYKSSDLDKDSYVSKREFPVLLRTERLLVGIC